ncbi:MAG: hypothetical protein FWF46_04575 [Oscillospiraceae bacterium]|nr:hypothetical protein [Oscillospiraceae bacterium]
MGKIKTRFTIIAVISIILFAVAITPISFQNDTFYTIKIGEYVLNNGITLNHDPFSWIQGLTYTFPHWAYDVFTYLVYNVGGFLGVYISTCILTAILGLAIFFVHSKVNKNQIIAFLLTIGVIWLMKDFITARAQLVSFIFFVIAIFFIEKFLETGRKRYAAGIIIIPIIIANVHAAVWPFYFILLLPYIGDYLINNFVVYFDVFYFRFKIKLKQKKIDKGKDEQEVEILTDKLNKLQIKLENALAKKQKEPKFLDKVKLEKSKNGKWLVLIAVICVFTGLCTPLKDTPYTYLIKIEQGDTIRNISEHLPLTIAQNSAFATFFILTIIVALFTKVKLRLSDWFMLGGLIVLAFMSRRQVSMAYLVGALVCGKLIVQLLEKYDKKGTEEMVKLIASFLGGTLTIAIVLIMCLTLVKPKLDDKFVPENWYPVKASDFLLNNVDISKMKLFNEYNYGSYLLYRGIPVFIDSRCDLYTPQFNPGENEFDDFLNITNLSASYEDEFAKYGITHVMLYVNSKLNLLLEKDSNYNVIYSDSNFIIYERLNANVEETVNAE